MQSINIGSFGSLGVERHSDIFKFVSQFIYYKYVTHKDVSSSVAADLLILGKYKQQQEYLRVSWP